MKKAFLLVAIAAMTMVGNTAQAGTITHGLGDVNNGTVDVGYDWSGDLGVIASSAGSGWASTYTTNVVDAVNEFKYDLKITTIDTGTAYTMEHKEPNGLDALGKHTGRFANGQGVVLTITNVTSTNAANTVSFAKWTHAAFEQLANSKKVNINGVDKTGAAAFDLSLTDNVLTLKTVDDNLRIYSADAQFTITAVPEPASALLAGFGAIGLGLIRRRRS